MIVAGMREQAAPDRQHKQRRDQHLNPLPTSSQFALGIDLWSEKIVFQIKRENSRCIHDDDDDSGDS